MYDINKIMERLPHSYPFLMIDRVIELKVNERIVALKNVTINEPFFQGHFPNFPIMPGVLIIEAIGQAGGILTLESFNIENEKIFVFFMGIDKVKFRKPVIPGDQLIIEAKILKKRSNVIKISGSAKVEDKIAAEAEFLATIGDKIYDT
jgi:3-hydroxyacyl-[acyl-carrier-protein] dehydratase